MHPAVQEVSKTSTKKITFTNVCKYLIREFKKILNCTGLVTLFGRLRESSKCVHSQSIFRSLMNYGIN